MKIPFWPLLWISGAVSQKMSVKVQQTAQLHDFSSYWNGIKNGQTEGAILDLGGGGEGAIGQLMGSAVTAIDIREDELAEAPDGPKKVVADARSLPFDAESFDCATAFYFLMYLAPDDLLTVFQEAHRVLKRGGHLFVWDTVIPKTHKHMEKLFVVPVKIQLPNKTQYTAYGTRWAHRELNTDILKQIAILAGFTVKTTQESQNKIVMTFSK